MDGLLRWCKKSQHGRVLRLGPSYEGVHEAIELRLPLGEPRVRVPYELRWQGRERGAGLRAQELISKAHKVRVPTLDHPALATDRSKRRPLDHDAMLRLWADQPAHCGARRPRRHDTSCVPLCHDVAARRTLRHERRLAVAVHGWRPGHGPSTPRLDPQNRGNLTKVFYKDFPTPTSFGRMGRTEHPMTSGWLAGTIEITVTYPLEFIKTQLQLQQQVSNT